jgi:hypothetical protein
VDYVKKECGEAATWLISKFKRRFLDFGLMNAFFVFFPQFWRKPDCNAKIQAHLAVLKTHYGTSK